jgi:starch synthase
LTKPNQLKICLASSELAPLAKTGGLADVTAALSVYLRRAGHDIRVLTPRYAQIDESDLEVEPVEGLADLRIKAGSRTISYSIEATVLPGTEMLVYLLDCPEFYARDAIYTQDADEYLRFVLLSHATLEMCRRMGFSPDIVQCNDWQTGLIPLYLRTTYAWDRRFANTRTVLTIHNIGYQGVFPAWTLRDLELIGAEHHLHQDDLEAGVINFLKTGLLYTDFITTVSPTYAREIMGEDYGMGLNGLLRDRIGTVAGILNGVDYGEWNPETDPLIPCNYSPEEMSGKLSCKRTLLREMGLYEDTNRPLIGIVSRLVGQKGIDLIENAMPRLIGERDFSLVILGSGEHRFEDFFTNLQQSFRSRVCFYRGFNNRLAHWIEAGSDMFLMPSRYEPCGLNQMYSLKYGTVPIVRETGGLADSVESIDPAAATGTGIVFRHYSEAGLAWAINTALDLYQRKPLWQQIVANGMAKDFSWDRQGTHYVDLFEKLSSKS